MAFLIADDHNLFRTGLRLLLADSFETIVQEARGLDEALDVLGSDPSIEFLLLDLRMPGMADPTNLGIPRQRYPNLKIAVISASEDRLDVIKSLAAGAHGFIPKTFDDDAIVDAIRYILAGGIFVPPHLAEVSATAAPTASLAPASPIPAQTAAQTPQRGEPPIELSPRQSEVLRLLGQGKSTKEIANALGLAEGTVKVHLAAVYRVLGARSRSEAVAKAARYLGSHPGC